MDQSGPGHSYDLVVVAAGSPASSPRLPQPPMPACSSLSKGPIGASSSYLAQGGLAAATRSGDSPEFHTQDTLRAGRGLSRRSAVEALTEEAPARIADLIALGVELRRGTGARRRPLPTARLQRRRRGDRRTDRPCPRRAPFWPSRWSRSARTSWRRSSGSPAAVASASSRIGAR